MTSIFDLAPQNQRYLEQQAQQSSNGMGPVPYRVTSDLKAPFIGLAASINDISMLAADAATDPLKQTVGKTIDSVFGSGTATQDWIENERKKTHDAARSLVPDETASWVGKDIMFGLTETVPQFIGGTIIGGGDPLAGAAFVGGIQANKTMQLARDQGVDPVTAMAMGGLAGIAGVAGAFLPVKAPSLIQGAFKGEVAQLTANLSTGLATNVPFGMVNRQATSALLEERGYPEMAQQYKALDGSAMLADAVMGMAFAGFGHWADARARAFQEGNPLLPKPTPEQVDAALTILNKQHAALETAPGLLTDPEAAMVHQRSLSTAIEQMLAGDPVDVGAAPTIAKFEENTHATQVRQEIAAAISEHIDLPRIEANQNGSLPRVPTNLAGAIMGDESFIRIGDQYVPVRYAVVDAANHQATLTVGENQFRNRTTPESEAQIAKIAGAPDFNLLNASPLMDYGAPTMNGEGKIIGGNGRFEGLSRGYDKGSAEGYRGSLERNLESFGIRQTATAGMKKPVLVRVIEADINTRQAAKASNEGGGARMSSIEQARHDAEAFPDITGIRVGENGEILSGPNHAVIMNWTKGLPDTERNAVVDQGGRLSAMGMSRFQNAILYKAFGDSPVLTRLIESLDPGARNVASALTKVAADIAKFKAAVEKGETYPQLDLTPDIMAAANKLEELRSAGTKVSDYINQGDLLGGDLNLEARKILQFFGDHMRSAKTMGEMLREYWGKVQELGNPKQGDLLGAREISSKGALLDQAIADTKKVAAAAEPELPFSNQITEKGLTGAESVDNSTTVKRSDQQIEADLQARVDNNFDQLVEEYSRLKDSEGGMVLNTDLARELSPDYLADRTKSAAVHEPASTFIKRLFAKKLAEPTPAGKEPVVLFSAGGTGAGKTSGLEAVPGLKSKVEMIYDTNMNKLASAASKIDQALEAGRDVAVFYTYREPVEALQNGALPRAMRQEEQFGSGRTVPLQEHINTHVGSRDVIDQLIAKYKNDERVTFQAIDNSRGKGNAVEMPVDKIPTIKLPGLEERLYDVLKQQYETGKISEAVYRGFSEGYTPKGAVTARNEGSPAKLEQGGIGIGREADFGQAVKSEAPRDFFDAANIVAERPDLMIPGPDGKLVPASEALAQADAEISMAKRDAQGYDAAAACALRG